MEGTERLFAVMLAELDPDIAVACPEWRGLKVTFLVSAANAAAIAVACPEWRGLKDVTVVKAENMESNCSGLPRMEGTESRYQNRGRSIHPLLQWLAPNGGD